MKTLKYLTLVLMLLFGVSKASAQGCAASTIMGSGGVNTYTTLSPSANTGTGTESNISSVVYTSITNNQATIVTANSFQVGQAVAVKGTTNGGGIFNGTWTIIYANPYGFIFNLVHANVASVPDTGFASILTVTQTSIVDGMINYTPSGYCTASGTPHYATVTQTLGSTTHTVSGTHVCPACSFTAEDTIWLVGFPGVIYADVVTGAATCAAGGWRFIKKFLDWDTEWAGTWQEVLPKQPTWVWVSVIPFCSNTTPTIPGVVPDFNPNIAGPNVVPPTPIIFGLGFVARYRLPGTKWYQAGPAFFTDSGFSPTDPFKPICTVTPNLY